jgi:hypothetical protein
MDEQMKIKLPPIYPNQQIKERAFCGVCGENATNPVEMSYEGVKQTPPSVTDRLIRRKRVLAFAPEESLRI